MCGVPPLRGCHPDDRATAQTDDRRTGLHRRVVTLTAPPFPVSSQVASFVVRA